MTNHGLRREKISIQSLPFASIGTGESGAHEFLNAAAVVVAYVVSAKIGLHLAFANKNVTAVWPPTGIAVAALLLLGAKIWPSVAVGAFLANLSNGASWDTSMLISVGNTAAPVTAWFLIRRLTPAKERLERVTDVASVLLLGGPVAMIVSASLGTGALVATTSLPWSQYGSTWLTWWVGDAMGVVIVTPLVLVVAARSWHCVDLHAWRGVEVLAALACIIGATTTIFDHNQPLTFLALPIAAWLAVRFFQLGAACAVAIVSGVSIMATVSGRGPLVHGMSTTASLITLQAFNGALALTTFILAAASFQHARAKAALEADAEDLGALLYQERRAALDDMAAVVSHDLRTPLSAVANSHYLLRNMFGDRLDHEVALILEVAERASQQAIALTEQILAFRRPRNLELDEVDLDQVIHRAIEIIPVSSGIVLTIDCPSIRIRVDSGQLTRILTNMITNACDAMAGSGSLHLFGRLDGDTVIVGAADTGPGFDEAIVDRAFEPFFSTKPMGTGLGLAIVQRFVEAHGGRVGIENRSTGGAVVSVSLPRGIASGRSEIPASS